MFRFLFKYFSKEAIKERKLKKAAKELGMSVDMLMTCAAVAEECPRTLIELERMPAKFKSACVDFTNFMEICARSKDEQLVESLRNVYIPLGTKMRNSLSFGEAAVALDMEVALRQSVDQIDKLIALPKPIEQAVTETLEALGNYNMPAMRLKMVQTALTSMYESLVPVERPKPTVQLPTASVPEISASREQVTIVKKHLSEDVKKEAVAAIKEGKLIKDVAAYYGVTNTTLRKWAKQYDPEFAATRSRPTQHKLSKKQTQQIKKRAKAGEKQKDLAIEFNVSPPRISKIVNSK